MPITRGLAEIPIEPQRKCVSITKVRGQVHQYLCFEDQLKLSEKGDDEAMFIDQDFLRALEYGIPPTSGMGIGMDRLIMFLTNNPSIQEVLFFPQMRPKNTKPQIELTEDEKLIVDLISHNDLPSDLNQIKEQVGLSNKKWDKSVKNLAKNNLIKVEKEGDNIVIKLL